MNRISRWLGIAIVCLTALSVGCGDDTGACDSSGRYCGDDYTSAECADHDAQQVNGESWTFYPGQTCADRGKSSTS